MSRMWKIMEEHRPDEMSYRHGGKYKHMGSEYEEAFEEGYECGFEEAMEMVEEKYGHMGFRGESRRTSGGSSYSRGSSSYGNRMGYRDEDDEDEMGERRGRRRRDSRGRYM